MSCLGALRVNSCSIVHWRAGRAGAADTAERWLDKNGHIVRRAVGCFRRVFGCQAHIAAVRRNVRRTSQALNPHSLFHIAGQRHGQ